MARWHWGVWLYSLVLRWWMLPPCLKGLRNALLELHQVAETIRWKQEWGRGKRLCPSPRFPNSLGLSYQLAVLSLGARTTMQHPGPLNCSCWLGWPGLNKAVSHTQPVAAGPGSSAGEATPLSLWIAGPDRGGAGPLLMSKLPRRDRNFIPLCVRIPEIMPLLSSWTGSRVPRELC